MKRHLQITNEPIEETVLVGMRPAHTGMGAVVCFAGVVRDREEGHSIQGILYESFEKMAEHQFGVIFDQVEKRWPIESIRLIHRVGWVAAGELSLWVEVVAPHRGEAFAACQYVIEEMKRVVPIWKRPRA